jgi:hypothetical protein
VVNLHIIPLMMEVEMVSEMLGFYPQLTWLVAREDFTELANVLQSKTIFTCSPKSDLHKWCQQIRVVWGQ